jgi:hypothetical protein
MTTSFTEEPTTSLPADGTTGSPYERRSTRRSHQEYRGARFYAAPVPGGRPTPHSAIRGDSDDRIRSDTDRWNPASTVEHDRLDHLVTEAPCAADAVTATRSTFIEVGVLGRDSCPL